METLFEKRFSGPDNNYINSKFGVKKTDTGKNIVSLRLESVRGPDIPARCINLNYYEIQWLKCNLVNTVEGRSRNVNGRNLSVKSEEHKGYVFIRIIQEKKGYRTSVSFPIFRNNEMVTFLEAMVDLIEIPVKKKEVEDSVFKKSLLSVVGYCFLRKLSIHHSCNSCNGNFCVEKKSHKSQWKSFMRSLFISLEAMNLVFDDPSPFFRDLHRKVLRYFGYEGYEVPRDLSEFFIGSVYPLLTGFDQGGISPKLVNSIDLIV